MSGTGNQIFDDAYNEVVKQLELAGIIPLIKIEDVSDALPLMGALTGANINVVEITFRTSAARDVLKLISKKCKNMQKKRPFRTLLK